MATAGRRIWDVTVPLQPGLPVWPGDPPVEMEPVSEIRRGDSCNVSLFRFGSHTGTHLDPPRHFFAEGTPLGALPLDLFLGSCFVAGVTEAVGAVDASDLDRANVPPNAERLLLKTSNSRLWDDPRHAFRPDFVDLAPDGAEWIVEREIRLVGIDYLSIEGPGNPACPVHRRLLAVPVVILEGLDLRAVEPGSYDLICLPLKAMNGDGAPARVLLARDELGT